MEPTPALPWRPQPKRALVVLVRHGQTSWNATHRFLGCTDIGLDDVGHAQAEHLGRLARGTLPRVISSPLSRAKQTAGYLHREPVEVVDALAELRQGELEGLTAPEAIGRFPDFFAAWAEDPGATPVPGGESLGSLRQRAWDAVEQIGTSTAPGEVVAVVTHQMVIASVLSTVAGTDLRHWRRHTVPNTSVSVIAWDGASWSEVERRWRPPGWDAVNVR
jgi:glucosyl-3-phosphoglycerate phosphatase